jgi:hypothetical protein
MTRGDYSMCPIIPTLAILIAQAQLSPTPKWCFERDQDAQLCEATEADCKKRLDINTEIARSPCKLIETAATAEPRKTDAH